MRGIFIRQWQLSYEKNARFRQTRTLRGDLSDNRLTMTHWLGKQMNDFSVSSQNAPTAKLRSVRRSRAKKSEGRKSGMAKEGERRHGDS
jgi:hypothetical protein